MRFVLVSIVASLLLCASVGASQDPPLGVKILPFNLHLPQGIQLQEVGVKDSLSLLTFDCEPVDSETVDCTFHTTHVRKTSEAELNEKESNLWTKEFRDKGRASVVTCMKDFGLENLRAHWDDLDASQQAFISAIYWPCRNQNADEFVDALKAALREMELNTCTVGTLYSKAGRFHKVSESTWEMIKGGGKKLGGSVIGTLWRDTDGISWNYRELRAGSPDCKSPLCPEPGVAEWTVKAKKPALECKWVVANPF